MGSPVGGPKSLAESIPEVSPALASPVPVNTGVQSHTWKKVALGFGIAGLVAFAATAAFATLALPAVAVVTLPLMTVVGISVGVMALGGLAATIAAVSLVVDRILNRNRHDEANILNNHLKSYGTDNPQSKKLETTQRNREIVVINDNIRKAEEAITNLENEISNEPNKEKRKDLKNEIVLLRATIEEFQAKLEGLRNSEPDNDDSKESLLLPPKLLHELQTRNEVTIENQSIHYNPIEKSNVKILNDLMAICGNNRDQAVNLAKLLSPDYAKLQSSDVRTSVRRGENDTFIITHRKSSSESVNFRVKASDLERGKISQAWLLDTTVAYHLPGVGDRSVSILTREFNNLQGLNRVTYSGAPPLELADVKPSERPAAIAKYLANEQLDHGIILPILQSLGKQPLEEVQISNYIRTDLGVDFSLQKLPKNEQIGFQETLNL